MAKDKLTDYNATATLNTDIGGINIDEGMLPSNVNNAMREQMSHLADFAAGTTGINVLNLQDDDASASIKIQAPAAVTTTTTLTLPDGAGSANQSLTTNGSGTLSWSTRIGNVVEDTTPQLGGNLDTNGNDITFGDNDKAIFGAGSDLQVYHNGSNSYIQEVGTGNLFIASDANVNITNQATSELKATFISNGAVNLYYDNAPRLATTATGIDVTGGITADDNINLESSTGYAHIEMGGSSGAYIDMKSPFSDDYDARLQWEGSNFLITTGATGGVHLQHNTATKLQTTSSGVDVTGTLGATTVDLGNWTITESAGVLYFATGGTNKMKIDASGNLTVVGDVTAFGSV